MLSRRGFLGMVTALPFVGRFVGPRCYEADCVHLNESGHAIILECIEEHITTDYSTSCASITVKIDGIVVAPYARPVMRPQS
jgi:hypothetical protein